MLLTNAEQPNVTLCSFLVVAAPHVVRLSNQEETSAMLYDFHKDRIGDGE